MKNLTFLSLAGAIAITMTSVVQAAPAKIWTSWQFSDLSKSQCMNRARNTITQLGYREIQVLESAVYGEASDTSVTIRCVTEQHLIFFIATDPDKTVASQHLTALIDRF